MDAQPLMARYSKAKIAAAKALLVEGFGPKLLARLSDIPFHTLRDWALERAHADIEPDQAVIQQLRALLTK
jgi:hypothetical protein